MGLDAVELLMEVEETFDIKIDDNDYPEIRTAGDLYDLIVARTPKQTSGRNCLSPRVFCRFRRALTTSFNIARSTIRLDTSLTSLIPEKNGRTSWSRLQESLGLTLPKLQRPTWVVHFLTLTTIMAFILLCLYTIIALEKSSIVAILLPALLTTIMGLLFAAITQPLAIQIPSSCTTVRGATSAVMVTNLFKLTAEEDCASETEIFEILRTIISCHLEVPFEKVTRDASLVNDLGMN
jgi:acyl carrier protein